MVRIAANTSAWLVEQKGDLLVKFDDSEAYPGVELWLSGARRARPLLLRRSKSRNSNSEMLLHLVAHDLR